MFIYCNLCGVAKMPSMSGLCDECYKISRLVKVSSSKRCLEILQCNIIIDDNKENSKIEEKT